MLKVSGTFNKHAKSENETQPSTLWLISLIIGIIKSHTNFYDRPSYLECTVVLTGFSLCTSPGTASCNVKCPPVRGKSINTKSLFKQGVTLGYYFSIINVHTSSHNYVPPLC